MRFSLKVPGKETKAELQRIADAAFASHESIQINKSCDILFLQT